MILRNLLTAVCGLLACLALALGLVCLANPHRPLGYLIDIFSVAGLTGTAVLTAGLWAMRQRIAKWIASLGLLVFVLAIWPQAFPAQAPPDREQPAVRLVFANLLIRNEEPQKILPWITRQNPDIVAFIEVNPGARDDLITALKVEHPYVVTRHDMIIASRWPLSNLRKGETGFSLITTTVKAPGGDMTLALTHLTRPWPFSRPQDQPRQFARLGAAIAPRAGERFVMVGDFNTPPCASGLGDFLKAHDLHAAPALSGTWISVLPGMLRVTIDNAMASRDLSFSRRQVGPYDGSDHRPIVVDIYPAKPR